MNKPTCKTCVYWYLDADFEECRKHPPVIIADSDGEAYPQWAGVGPDGWCGEHPDFPKYIKSLEGGDA